MAIGDVKHSILAPDQFREINGEGWIPLDGGVWAAENNTDLLLTDLQVKFGISTIPDARAMFVRACNMGREDQFKDPDGERSAGSFQTEEFKAHNHGYTSPQGVGHLGNFNHQGWEGTPGAPTSHSGGVETRPNNISLFVYIQVTDTDI